MFALHLRTLLIDGRINRGISWQVARTRQYKALDNDCDAFLVGEFC